MAVKPAASAASGPKPAARPASVTWSAAAPATGGYLRVREMQPNGNYKIVEMSRSAMSAAQLKAALANGLNAERGGSPAPAPAATAPAPGNTAPAPSPAAPAPAAPSWIPRIGFNGITPDVNTGQINWTAILDAAKTISAVDPQYAQDLSTNILTAQQTIAPIQAQYQGLNSIVIDPLTGQSTGKKKFELDEAAEKKGFGQNQSSAFGNAARRGIGSSGMINSNLAKNNIAHGSAMSNIDQTVGKTAITNLYNQILGTIGTQDMSNYSSYLAALGRQQATLPSVAGAAGLS